MLAIIAAILFGIAFVINATGTVVTNAAFSVTGLLPMWPPVRRPSGRR
jgi:hypothetical protein